MLYMPFSGLNYPDLHSIPTQAYQGCIWRLAAWLVL